MGRRKKPLPPKTRNYLERAFGCDLWDAAGRPLYAQHVSRVWKAVSRRFGDQQPRRAELIEYFRSEQFQSGTTDIGAGTVRWVYRMMRMGLPPALDLTAFDDLLATFPDVTVTATPSRGYRAQLGEWVGYGALPSEAVASVVRQFHTGAPA